MSTEQIHLTEGEIRKIMYPLRIPHKDREEVSTLLNSLRSEVIWRRVLHLELEKMRKEYKISAPTINVVEEALFGE